MKDDIHGGNLYRVARERGCRPSDLVDFSASINPLGPSLSILRQLRKSQWMLRHYPDPEAHDLVQALSKRSGLDPACYLIGNGSMELLYLLPLALSITKALIIGPTFSEYERAVSRAGGHGTHLSAIRADEYRPPIEEAVTLLRAGKRTFDAVFLCNPNNPTGRVIAKGDLLQFVAALDDQHIWMVVDESFMDFAPEQSVLQAVSKHPRILILRSFTKFYAIPGLRIGYLAGQPDVVEQVRRRQPPWSVNALAQTAALACLKDTAYRKKSLALISEERARLSQVLSMMPDLHVFPSEANFLLIELPASLRASDVAEQLRDRGLLVRDCSTIAGLTDRMVRVAVRIPRENDRLLRVIEVILRG
ncbi:MAG TPA: threonine-phosphate decarboxylase CobD [Nitrospiraceae bacterium]|nr:threonine-phosphate decarboxylase CobD [Nitrospiraceae bacterium]